MSVRRIRKLKSPELGNRRDVDIYMPESYRPGSSARYPVVYMQDGQNLSDPSIAFGGNTWQIESALDRLSERGLDAIVVGVHHAGRRRIAEYSPFPDRRHGGGDADAYLAFLVNTLKPRIDRRFRTRAGRDDTAIVGSSMGGLVSLYAYFRYPYVFGRAGVLSPSIWFGQGAILDFIREARTPRGRIYLDVGTAEGAGTLRDVRALGRLLVRKGLERHVRKPALRYVEDRDGRHSEADWAQRIEGALEFLLS
jgi:predicted alpha/beta superfamily hydrolase